MLAPTQSLSSPSLPYFPSLLPSPPPPSSPPPRSYRASSTHGVGAASSLVNAFHMIKDVQKRFKTREQEKREMEGIVEQEALVLNTMKGNPRLKDLYMRPVIGSRRVQVYCGTPPVRTLLKCGHLRIPASFPIEYFKPRNRNTSLNRTLYVPQRSHCI